MDLGFSGGNQAVGRNAAKMLEQIVGMQENMLDAELQSLDNLGDDQIAQIRAKRLQDMKSRKQEEAEWSRNHHGTLTTLSEVKEFFAAAKASKRFVCHFARPTSHHCAAVDGHLMRLAATHKESRFATVNAEKVPYLCEKLLADPEGNVVIPTILLCIDGKVVYHIRGLHEIGGEKMTTDHIATVLAMHGLIEGEAATEEYEEKPQFASMEEYRAHAIREGFFDQGLDDDDENFSDDEFTCDAHDA